VKERTIHINVIENIMKDLEQYGLGISKLIPSPIFGGSGNKEFLCLIERNIKTKINVVEAIKE
jgi:predicted rRNA methylase YqxC with S4 and FtsJ domains